MVILDQTNLSPKQKKMSSTPFTEYSKMENIRSKFFGLIVGDVVLVEKVHGSNFQFCVTINPNEDEYDIKIGKRTDFLTDKDAKKFYGAYDVKNKYIDRITKLCTEIYEKSSQDKTEPTVIIIYGELYGGHYNHVIEGVCVQRGVDYCPTNEFICFDISVNGEFFLWDELKRICGECQFPIVPEVARGNFEKLYKEFDLHGMKSHVPKEIHGLNAIESRSEGVIIRSLTGICPSFKWKQSWLKEEPAWKPGVLNEGDELFTTLLLYLNEARFAAWCSKRSPDDIENTKNMGGNIKSLVSDAVDSIKIDHPELEKAYLKKLWKPMSSRAKKFIVSYEAPIDTTISPDERIRKIEVDQDRHLSEIDAIKVRLANINMRLN